VFVKILKPRLISSDNGNASREGSSSGVLGNSHAATIVALAAMSGPFIFAAGRPDVREHATARGATRRSTAPVLNVMRCRRPSIDKIILRA
jgi:hypothetical protein